MMTSPGGTRIDPSHTLTDAAAAALRGAGIDASDEPSTWLVRRGAVSYATRMGTQGRSEFALVIDDRSEALGTEGFAEAWRLWLHLSNVIGWREDLSGVEIIALSQVGAGTPATGLGPVDMPESPISIEWEALAENATSAERLVISRLAAAARVPVPAMGIELGDGIPFSFVWQDERVAAATGLTDEDRRELAGQGWTAVDVDAETIIDALSHAGRN